MTFKPQNPTMEINNTTGKAHDVSELLEDAGNCRKNLNQELSLHLLSDTCCSEHQKLRHVLDWAHRFLSSGSEVYHELCRADSLILVNEKKETEKSLPACEDPSAAKYRCQVSCAVGTHDVLGGGNTVKVGQPSNYKNSEQNNFLSRFKSPLQDDLHTPRSFTQGRDETIWTEGQEIKNMKNMRLQQSTNKPTSNQEHRSGATVSMSEPEEIPGQTRHPSFSHHLNISPNLTVYEQYQLFVDQLYQLRRCQNMKWACSLESSANVKKTTKEKTASVEASAPPCYGLITTSQNKQLIKARSRVVTAAQTTEKWCLGAIGKNQGRTSSSASTRPQSAAKNMERLISKKRTLEDRAKLTSLYRDTHSCLQSTETHTCHHDDTRPTLPASGKVNNKFTASLKIFLKP